MGGQGLFVRRRLGGAETCGLMPLTNCGAGRTHRPLQLFPFGGILRLTVVVGLMGVGNRWPWLIPAAGGLCFGTCSGCMLDRF